MSGTDQIAASPEADRRPPITPRLAWWIILLAAGVLRIALWSGYGLGDDPGFFFCYRDILRSGTWQVARAYDWRFGFWVPVVLSMRLFGVTEWSFVGFITVCSVVNVVLVWALARQEWREPWAALAAMALMAVLPLEVLSGTLFVIDVPLATYAFGAFWLYREALAGRQRRWVRVAEAVGAGLLLFVAYTAKQWSVLVGVLFAIEALRRLRTTWAWSALCGGSFAAFMGAYMGWQWWRFGDPIMDVHVVRRVAAFLPHSWDIVTDYSRMLLLRNENGSWFTGWYVHATLVLAVVFLRRLPQAGKWLGYFLLELACLSAMPSHRENGQWVLLVPHIFRYLCFLSIPLCLALAAYVRELALWRPAATAVATAVFLGLSVVQAVELTWPTRDVFGEGRRVNAFLLEEFPDERFISDMGFLSRLQNFHFDGSRWNRLSWLRQETPEGQARELGAVRDGVVITGGGRLPWYGCLRCAMTMERFTPPPTWRLVETFDGPLGFYRKEPLRIWRVSAAEGRAGALLAPATTPEARLAVLRQLIADRDWLVAVEVGRRLASEGVEPRAQVAYLTGLACARAERPGCASENLERALDAGLDQGTAADAVVQLVETAQSQRKFATARGWIARYRERFPGAPPNAAIDEVASGMTEAFALYHLGRYTEADRLFSEIRARAVELPQRRQRAHYFVALTAFRLGALDRAVGEMQAYRDRYGADELYVELTFRNAEARREIDPTTARALFAEVALRHPDTVWGQEAQKQMAQLDTATRGK